jgi:hypothetical protein
MSGYLTSYRSTGSDRLKTDEHATYSVALFAAKRISAEADVPGYVELWVKSNRPGYPDHLVSTFKDGEMA